MKISETVIDKLSLYRTNIWVGRSFMLDLCAFKSTHKELEGCLFLECDMSGEPSKYVTFYNYSSKAWAYVTLDFLESETLEVIANTLTILTE